MEFILYVLSIVTYVHTLRDILCNHLYSCHVYWSVRMLATLIGWRVILIIYMFSHKSSFFTIVLQCLCMHINVNSGITRKFIISHSASSAVMRLMYLQLHSFFFTCCHLLGQWHALNLYKGHVLSRQIIAQKTGVWGSFVKQMKK